MAVEDPVAALDRLLLDDPYGDETEALMTVAGDLLQAQGRVRGEHIAMEQAWAQALDADARARANKSYAAWQTAHESALFGSLATLGRQSGAMRTEFRGGRLRGLTLDLRRMVRPGVDLSLPELMQLVLAAPALRHLVELRVRVRHERDAGQVFTAIERGARKLPLEILIISPTTRPLGHQVRGHAAPLRKHFPHLWFVTRFGRVTPVIDPELADVTVAHALAGFGGEAMSQELRIRIGRGLSSGREHTTRAACDLLGGLGSSGRVFVPILDLLLRPQVSHAVEWILPALPSFGPWAQPLAARVARMSGDPRRYPERVRALAGKVASQLRTG